MSIEIVPVYGSVIIENRLVAGANYFEAQSRRIVKDETGDITEISAWENTGARLYD